MGWIGARGWRLLVLTALPLAVAALGMLWSASWMLDGISVSVDKQEQARTWQAVRSAFAAAEERLAGTIIDNAHWDDAARQSYGPIDDQWMSETWGVGTADINYDTMFVADAEGKLITGYHLGEKSQVSPESYLGTALQETLKSLPMDGTTFAALSSLVNTPDGLSIMAAAPILPTSDDIKISEHGPNLLIFTRALTPESMAKLGEQYIVDGLELSPAGIAENGANILNDRWGNPIARVTWQMRHPGDAARSSYRFSVFAIILALIGVMVPISLVHYRAMSKLETNEKTASLAARHDSLSGLPNRVFLLEQLTRQLAGAKPSELALIFVDLDGFKSVNDAYDHETGDKLIRAVAAGLSNLVAGHGVLARLGGDEFAILINGGDAVQRAEAIAGNVLAFVREPFDIDGRIANIGASIGIAELGADRLEPAEFMRRADIAMYDAKNSGRNQWRRFDIALDVKRSENVAIANELRTFISQGDFGVAYQPMVDSRSRAIVGVEALARWPAASADRLEPSRFIAVAEEHGLIDGLGSLILRTACRDMAQWQDLRLAVNISPLQLNNGNFVSELSRIVASTSFDPRRLEIELTETVLIKNPRRARQVIEELHALGVTVALDDFGTGYASVGYLREFAFDRIKLDKSLTRAISREPAAQQVVQGTVLIARGLSAEIIAEGIETEEEAQLMHLSGCHQLQGHHFGRPQEIGMLLPLEIPGQAKRFA